MEERLQKVLAHAGVASRRAAERLVLDGRVTVNGQIVRTLGLKVDASRDALAVDGRSIASAEPLAYLMLHKPRGYVSTVRDERGRPTVRQLAGVREHVYPVGRLDVDTEGLLLLTNDGELALHLTHPRYGVPKEYQALVEGVPDAQALARLRRGLALEEGQTAPARVALLSTHGALSWVSVELKQGWKRQVRRMLEAVGFPVQRLIRTRVGSVTLSRLPLGAVRPLTSAEIDRLRRESGLVADHAVG
jgi:23S rRNA pseudouridine2605 synthase